MKLIELEKEKYEEYMESHNAHFLQSGIWGEFSKKTRKLEPFYLGLLDDRDNILGGALLLQKKLLFGYSYFYAPRGFIIDYKDFNIVEEMTKEIKTYAKKKKAIFVKIDPDIYLQKLDIDGNIVDKDNNNFKLVDYLKKLGYHHKGFNKNFENSEPRYTFRLDLTKSLEEIEMNFHPTTRKIIHRGNPFQFQCFKNDDAKIEDFYITMQETSKREGVVYHNLEYYKEFYEILHRNNHSDLYVVTADIPLIQKIYKDKIKELKENIQELEEKGNEKSKNKITDFKNQLTKYEKEYEEVKNIKEDKLILSSILTAKYGNKVWTVHGGNHSLLRNLNANYFIYYEIIKDAKEEGYQLIDFFGTTGTPTKDNPIYGIHLFKSRLGGEYTEFIGEFDLVIHPFLYFAFEKLIPFYRKIGRQKARKENDMGDDK